MLKIPKGKYFLRMAGSALIIGLKAIPGYGMAVELTQECWKILKEAQDESEETERVPQLEEAGQYSPQEAREIAEELIAEKRSEGITITGEQAEAVADLLSTMPAVIREQTQATLRQARRTQTAPQLIFPVTQQFGENERAAFYQSLFPKWRSSFKAGDPLPNGNPQWQLQTLVGMGGFGEVWKVEHQFLNESRAVKFCRNPESVKVLKREAKIAKMLHSLKKVFPVHHASIVGLKDLQFQYEPYWLAFEYVPKGTLESLMRLGAMKYEEALDLLLPVIEAMAEVHKQGIVHRDLKPGNLLLGADNVLKIADFGIGKVMIKQEGQEGLTKTGSFTATGFGSEGYMSPEQKDSLPAHCADDVYALAVIFCQMCSGHLKPLHFPDKIRRLQLPLDVEELLIDCIFKPREHRPQNAGEMVEVLRKEGNSAVLVASKGDSVLKWLQENTPWAQAVNQDDYGIYAEFVYKKVTQTMRWIEPGEFLMGSPKDEPERYDDETQHKVRITQGYWLADTACTQALWQAVMGDNPSHFKGQDNPVEKVSWNDIQNFLKKLNQQNPGLKARLPTEAQWEYACRAGTTTPFWFGNNITPEQVNYDGNYPYPGGKKGRYRGQTVPVKELPCNSWGLYQMHGNVYEWCQDWYSDYPQHSLDDPVTDPEGPRSGSSRVLRGGLLEPPRPVRPVC